MHRRRYNQGPPDAHNPSAIFVHAGAGYHSYTNEKYHLAAVEDATRVGMKLLQNGATAVEAVEMAVKVLEDREITNAGYGSNLTLDGTVECDATIVDHYGRSGAVGAVPGKCTSPPVSQIRSLTPIRGIKNPVGLARIILDASTKPMSLQRVPPNLLVGDGATRFAQENGVRTVTNEELVSASARERWKKWGDDLRQADQDDSQPPLLEADAHAHSLATTGAIPSASGAVYHQNSPPRTPQARGASVPRLLSDLHTPVRPLQASSSDIPTLQSFDRHDNDAFENRTTRNPSMYTADGTHATSNENTENTSSEESRRFKRQRTDGSADDEESDDEITDTVGAIAIDQYGNIAAASSSGGIGMKHKGRCGPAALVGVGTAVVPVDSQDPLRTCVAAVTSGTGEHMATTSAAQTIADRLYSCMRKDVHGLHGCDEHEAMASMIENEFMNHPGVRHSHCAGALGVLAVKKTKEGSHLYFGHNTDSFALASFHSYEKSPNCVMSRGKGNGAVALGGRAINGVLRRG